jgi:hypothetical protein
MARMKEPSPGKCGLCQGTFDKSEMTRHLKKCLGEHPAVAEATAAKPARLLHILVEGLHSPQYWMHLEAPAKARLLDLDGFLRDTWLECCGHMSAFRIGKVQYQVEADPEFEARSMKVALGEVLAPGAKFGHEYDFGTTTHLALKVVAEREGPAAGKGPKAVRVLARNEPPKISCACGQPATQVCGQCICDDSGWLCEKCVADHECGEEMCLPVVNSPRVGQCGYTGPAKGWQPTGG